MALVFDIKHFAVHDGDGVRTTIFFKGCPLRCVWCHNPESLCSVVEQFNTVKVFDGVDLDIVKTVGEELSTDKLMEEIMKDAIFYNQSGGGVTVSGGEPLMQVDALLELLFRCKKQGLHTAVDTSGYASEEVFRRVVDSNLVDLFLFDIKLVDSTAHKNATSRGNTLIFNNLNYLASSGIRTVLRVPMIPQYSFTDSNIKLLIEFLATIKSTNIAEITLLPYHNIANHKYAQLGYHTLIDSSIQPLSKGALEPLQAELSALGWSVSIG